MENEVIDVEAEVIKNNEPTDKTLKLIDELNEQVSNNNGEWLWDKSLGMVWRPNISPMPHGPEPLAPTQPSDPPPLLGDIIKWGNTLDFDNIPQNSVLLIKLDISDPFRVQMMQKIITQQVLQPRIEKLKEKHVCVLFMQSDDDISIMPEEDMAKAGWVKKEPSRIITLS
jgi:hypothetical protein